LTHFLARSESNAPSQAKEGGKTLSRRPGVKDNDWLIFLEYDALCIFCIPYPNQESLTNSPEVFLFARFLLSLRAFSRSSRSPNLKTSGPRVGGCWSKITFYPLNGKSLRLQVKVNDPKATLTLWQTNGKMGNQIAATRLEKNPSSLGDALLGPLRDCKNMAQVPYLREGQGVYDSRLTLIGKLTPLPG
jgi:hypothetical protein